MDKDTIKYVVVIQCEHTMKRCSGFACSESFFGKSAAFAGYNNGTKYLTMSCGGCNGACVAGRLEHFEMKLRTLTDIKKSEVAVHLASCVVTDNRHHDRCPYVDYIEEIIRKNGFDNIVEGTYQSQASRELRQKGVYKTYDSVAFE
ncbi:MAG: CGGC domain-containing protein [Firmicutes bacterium]|nr:CGGC domain-containing protein [Bacillota bacterium]